MKHGIIRTFVLAAAMTAVVAGAAQAGAGAKLVPEAVRQAGKITVGSQQTFPPIEFREPGASEVTGASSDLLHEIAKRLELKLEYVQAEYAALIPGIEAKRFDVASGGISDTEEREQKLDFVNYMLSGGSAMVRTEDADKYKTIADFCGKSVATLLGSRVIMAKVEEASAACTAKGEAEIRAEQLPSAPDARMQLDLKRVDAYLGDFPALVYMSGQFPGKYSIVGGNYMLTPYITSWGFSKDNTGLRDAVKLTLQEMLADGGYKSIMDKWGVGGALLPEITVNLPASKR
ncbi:transporter substrate-binding domain-containing protein [Ensifer sp. T173]|jgi:polar amino acid transport system substrate-binding protein|uniref:Transporter substrate-binding domain-containing protein n=1 Tax=Ensifer canadensis TaxID=555315 RepID=A0AAW4FUY9_9HYPH|nr:ABC transporter substrate-binding protein [Ensifer canadensis]MBM3095217.1 transporter substrate-binding domain-containing protein [Ensifer canadensis]UBI79483.1 ABC transporter substrate-binding protein [Ensifer canadensis]